LRAQDLFPLTMDTPLYHVGRFLFACIQALPLLWVARLGRFAGGLAFWLDGRHREVAIANLTRCFGDTLSRPEIRSLAKENFRRIGDNLGCAVKTASMSIEDLRPHLEFVVPQSFISPPAGEPIPRLVMAIGHFGNFELYARFAQLAPSYRCATTYRALRQDPINLLISSLRSSSGCLYFERRFDGAALKAYMHDPGVMLGLLADQHGGDSGLRIPFLGRDCSTSPAPAIFALRYNCKLYTAACFRVAPARWRIEAGPEIPTHLEGRPRTVADITLDMNRALEEAVRRDPANWFWVHNRWKAKKYRGDRLTSGNVQAEDQARPLPPQTTNNRRK
jgi:lauroyl/myristoyl acyltransferase